MGPVRISPEVKVRYCRYVCIAFVLFVMPFFAPYYKKIESRVQVLQMRVAKWGQGPVLCTNILRNSRRSVTYPFNTYLYKRIYS